MFLNVRYGKLTCVVCAHWKENAVRTYDVSTGNVDYNDITEYCLMQRCDKKASDSCVQHVLRSLYR